MAELTHALWVDSEATFLDGEQHRRPVRITGGWQRQVTTDGDNSGRILSIQVFPASESTRVTITTRRGQTTTAEGIVIHGSAGGFVAATTSLSGDMTVSGSLVTLTLGDVPGGRTIDIHTDDTILVPFTLEMSVTLGNVSDVQFDTHGLAVKSLTAAQWVDGGADLTNDRSPFPGWTS